MATKTEGIRVVDGRLVVDVPLTAGVRSKSGKSLVFFTTNGNIKIEGGYSIGITLYKGQS